MALSLFRGNYVQACTVLRPDDGAADQGAPIRLDRTLWPSASLLYGRTSRRRLRSPGPSLQFRPPPGGAALPRLSRPRPAPPSAPQPAPPSSAQAAALQPRPCPGGGGGRAVGRQQLRGGGGRAAAQAGQGRSTGRPQPRRGAGPWGERSPGLGGACEEGAPADMSGKIEKADSQRSHLSSFTMKLKDKFHSPKIRRTNSKKGKSVDLTVKPTEKPVNKSLSHLEEQEKDVVSALRYFKTIVDKMAIDSKVLEMLPGSASKVLEAILPLVQVDMRVQQSSAVSSCYSRVYQSLANLIRWSDQVMLEGINSEDKEVVTTVREVIKAVLDGVKELVRLTIEKQEHPSQTSPTKPSLPACKSDSICSTTDLPLTEREMEILNKSSPVTPPVEELPNADEEEEAPPKPPLPGIRVVENSPPPALPPKKRQSAPSPTRVAVVAPMSRATSGSSLPIGISKQDFDVDCYTPRRLSGGSHSYGGESPRLSPCSSIGKLSKSDEQLSSLDRDSGQCSRNTSCETLDNYDPDYEFLQQDLSSADQIPQLTPGVLSPLPESLGELGSPFHGQVFQMPPGDSPQTEAMQGGDAPPALPLKKRRSTTPHLSDISSCRISYERHPSQYDNISEDETSLSSLPSASVPPFSGISPFQQANSSGSVDFMGDFAALESDGLPEKPPPLPEKKNKHMLAYMQLLEDYSEPQPSMFYRTPQHEHVYQQKNKHLREVYGFNDSFSSIDSGNELAPPPALPPKQRQMSENASEEAGEGEYVNLYSSSQSNGELPHSDGDSPPLKDGFQEDGLPHAGPSGKESHGSLERHHTLPDSLNEEEDLDETHELFLIDHNEIMSRLTLKQEGDDGPDVRGGSVDILLVHATETDRKDLVLYCEAFLTTYRTFISPGELIQKLQYRYPLCVVLGWCCVVLGTVRGGGLRSHHYPDKTPSVFIVTQQQ
ncbi:hypothetical protein NDU88_000592 [Pleurodeles waltl]|uniref:N-terminal Ras-GEF domain-containing protein n=1 Tax=Pleurodeles waltl TaxID=8319 RepID=A0AAV7Q7F2_PLEWA|nr:hypothetical protein NDU88_000592 [Pleurodeles waltl]